MTEGKKKREDVNVSLDLGFGGLFKGLGEFIDLLGNMVETSEAVSRTGEFRVKGVEEKDLKGVYGFSVRTGVGGVPKVERFGNIRSTEKGPVVAEAREPMVDVFDEEGEVVVVVELPGVGDEEIEIDVQDDILSLKTLGERKYAKEVLLPETVDAATLQQTHKNGILELRLAKAEGG